MNKFDEISNFLSTEPEIKKDYEYLTRYISVFLYKNPNREKLQEFYNRIPEIIDRIFGISAKSKSNKQITKSLVDILNDQQTTFEEFDTILHLLLPGLENIIKNNVKNLFQSINTPPDYVPDYKIPTRIISKSINTIVTEKKQDYLFSMLEIFKNLSIQPEDQFDELENGLIRLNLFEYFIMLFMIAIKENCPYPYKPNTVQSKNKINLPKYNENFSNVNKNMKLKKILSEKTQENLYSIDNSKSLVYNFFLILFKNFINYMCSSRYINDQMKLKLVVNLVEMIWLSDYFIIPSALYMNKNNVETYSIFFRKENQLNNMNINNFSPQNIILLDCLQNLIINLQSGNYLFREQLYNNSHKSYILDKDGPIFILQKPLFFFFKTSFLRFSEIYSSNSEVNLSDIAKIWFDFITPWMQLKDVNGSNSNNQSLYYNNKGNTIDDAVREFIYMNLLFYTELLNDYIFAFSSLHVLNKNELSLLNKVLDLYKIKNGDFINEYVNMKLLEDLSLNKIYNYNTLIEVEHHIKYIGSFKKNLFPFNTNENKKYARVIVNNISTWIYKLECKEENINDEIANLVNTLKESQIILKMLYKIHDDSDDAIEQSNQKNYLNDYNNVFSKKDVVFHFQGNPWMKKLSAEENSILYYILINLAYLIDYSKGIPIRYDRRGNREMPISNLRYLCNYFNFGALVVSLLILLLIMKLIFRLILN